MEKMPSTRTLKAKKEENQWKDEGKEIIYSSLGRGERVFFSQGLEQGGRG
jgi:hypothetical protein